MKTIICERVLHKGENRVTLRFPYDNELIKITRSIPGSKWSQSLYSWHIPDDAELFKDLAGLYSGLAVLDDSGLRTHHPENIGVQKADERKEKISQPDISIEIRRIPLSEKGKADIDKFRRWMESNRYPESTIRTYTGMITTFLRFINPKEAEEFTSEDLVRIVDEYILPNNLSRSFQNQMISAIKKFYGKIYKSVIDPGEISRPRPQHRLPNVLSKEEVKRILDSVVNEKHRTMLSLVYGCGLRRSEVLELLPSDIDKDRRLMHIRQSKGFKDRIVPLTDKLLQMLDLYLLHYKPVKYLFEGQYSGRQYSPESLEKVFRTAYEKAGIKKKDITLHGLRHSYATHLLEAGTDLRYIQALLGHKSSRTTEMYTHVTTHSIQNIRSPFDDL